MLSMNSNEIIIDKNSSSIQISNKISSTQRKCYNYMLKIAKNEFKKDIEIIKIEPKDDFINTLEQSKADIKNGNVSLFDFDEFEKKIG